MSEKENIETNIEEKVEENTGLLGKYNPNDLKKEEVSTEIELRPEAKASEDQFTEKKLERPEGLPENLWNEEKGNFNSMELYTQWKTEKEKALGLRQQISKGFQKAPDKPEGYELNIEELQKSTKIDFKEDDLGLKVAREAAFESGLSKNQFETFINKYMKDMVDSGALDKSKEQTEKVTVEQQEEQRKAFVQEETKKLGANHVQIIQSVKNWGQQQVHNGVFSEEDYKAFLDLGYDSRSIRVLNILRKASGDLSIPNTVTPTDGSYAREEIDALIASPDYGTNKVSQRKVTEYFERLHSK